MAGTCSMARPSVAYGYRFDECKAKLSAVVKLETYNLITKLVDHLRSNYQSGVKIDKYYLIEAVIPMNFTNYRFKIV